jgi:multicomponent Na+:H+ antiporter subunit E
MDKSSCWSWEASNLLAKADKINAGAAMSRLEGNVPADPGCSATTNGTTMRQFGLAGFMFAFWLVLSGHYTPMLVAAGAASAVLCVLAMIRGRVADAEGSPIELLWGAVTYYPWLIREIAKSAWAVTRIILHPSLPISPTMTVVRASQRTSVGVATYANSITLTPGTITVGVHGNDLTVHALVNEGALDLEGGGMDRRVSQFEGTA